MSAEDQAFYVPMAFAMAPAVILMVLAVLAMLKSVGGDRADS